MRKVYKKIGLIERYNIRRVYEKIGLMSFIER